MSALATVAASGRLDRVYVCVVDMPDHLVRSDGSQFDADDYRQHPQHYRSNFAATVLPYASVIVNGISWTSEQPRLIASGWRLPSRLLAICDISADPGGSIEFVHASTTIARPFRTYDADGKELSGDAAAESASGVLVCAIDNMPAQMPLEATSHFGDLLLPHMGEIVSCVSLSQFSQLKVRADQPIAQQSISAEVRRAVVTNQGRLTNNFAYIQQMRKDSATAPRRLTSTTPTDDLCQKRVLLLGAGFVSGPLVDYFGRRATRVTAVSCNHGDLARLSAAHVTPVVCDVQADAAALDALVAQHDVVVSLLPVALHTLVAEACLRHGRHLVTTSYVSAQMQTLHEAWVIR